MKVNRPRRKQTTTQVESAKKRNVTRKRSTISMKASGKGTTSEKNDKLLNGSLHGLCVVFAGINNDVKLTGRFPILECMHEKQLTKKREMHYKQE